MADATVLGHFLWHDLITTDMQGAIAFYRKVVGWKTQAWDVDRNYTMWVSKSGPVGGIGALPDSQRAAGAKPHWRAYIGTTDVQATINDATRLGGLVVLHATEIPNGGRYAVLADPQGALFGVYSSSQASVPAPSSRLGDFSWHELATSDHQKAFAFYQQLFGWQKTGEHDMGAMGTYLMFGLDGVSFGGMFNRPGDMPSEWVNYASVSDAHAAATATTAAGGQVINGPMEVPGGDWITQIIDPQGATFAVHALKQAKEKPAESVAPAKSQAKTAAAKSAAKQPAKTAAKSKNPAVKRAKPVKAKAKAAPKLKRSASKKAARKVAKKAAKKASRKTSRKVAKKAARPTAKKQASKKKLTQRTSTKKKSAKRSNRRARKAVRRRR